MRSKPRLALAVVTSPLSAFQEILERRLLADAAWVIALAGLLAMFTAIVRVPMLGTEHLYVIGRDNPITWLGLWMLYSLAMWGLLKWLGAELDYVSVLIVVGWSAVLLVIHQALGLAWGVLVAMGITGELPVRIFAALGMVLPIMYVLAIGRGIQATGRATFAKGMLTYMIATAAVVVGLEQLYTSRLLAPFNGSLPGVSFAAMRLAPALYSTDTDPWMRGSAQWVRLVLGVIGLVMGAWQLGKSQTWNTQLRNKAIAAAAALGVLILGAYDYAWTRNSYYHNLLQAQARYQHKDYAAAARSVEKIIPRPGKMGPSTWDFLNRAMPLSDAALLHYLAGQPDKSLEYSTRLYKTAREYAPNQDTRDALTRQAYTATGMAQDQAGNYPQAIEAFKKAAAIKPEFREPSVRMAITYDKMGRYKDAITAGNHAVKKLNSEAALAWVALAQAFANTGDTKQAKVAITMLAGKDPKLAAKLGDSPEDYRNAVSRLTPEDLRPPLETRPADAAEEPVGK